MNAHPAILDLLYVPEVLPEINMETGSEVAARSILDAIVDGRFPPGAPLRLQDLSPLGAF